MTPLSPKTRQHIEKLFASAAHDEAERMLLTWNEGSERLRFAALRFSGGDLPGLERALEVGRKDWRDLLVWSGFGDDVRAHETWVPRPLTPQLLDAWRSGEEVDGVAFRFGDKVQRRNAWALGPRGRIKTLVALEPEAMYLVTLESGGDVRVDQFGLQFAE